MNVRLFINGEGVFPKEEAEASRPFNLYAEGTKIPDIVYFVVTQQNDNELLFRICDLNADDDMRRFKIAIELKNLTELKNETAITDELLTMRLLYTKESMVKFEEIEPGSRKIFYAIWTKGIPVLIQCLQKAQLEYCNGTRTTMHKPWLHVLNNKQMKQLNEVLENKISTKALRV